MSDPIGQTDQTLEDNSARVSVDLSRVIRAMCRDEPRRLQCARECYKDHSLDFCPALDSHCEAPPEEDVEFCVEWREKRAAAAQ